MLQWFKLCFNPDLVRLLATERHLLDGHHFVGTYIMSLKEKYSHRELVQKCPWHTNIGMACLQSTRLQSCHDRSRGDQWRASQDHPCRRAQTSLSPLGSQYAHWQAWLAPGMEKNRERERMCNYVCQISNCVVLCLPATSQKQVSTSQQAVSLRRHNSGLPIRAVIIDYSGNRTIIVTFNQEITDYF